MSHDPEGDALIRAIDLAIDAVRAHSFPELIVENVTDDGETYEALRCPRCSELVTDNESSLVSVDWSMHWQHGSDSSVEDRDITFDAEDRDLDETAYYLHNDSHAVALPEGFREHWS